MAQRHGVHERRRLDAEGGESPNRYVPQITVELRVFYPPGHGNEQRALDALTDAFWDARDKLAAQAAEQAAKEEAR